MGTSIAIVEDDAALRALLRRGLAEEGFEVSLDSATGGGLLTYLDDATPDVIVLDLGLPDADGRDVLLALRARGCDTPVLLLTARSHVADRLSGFHAGADDYLPKPFVFEELVVRIRALARRATADRVVDSDLHLSPERHSMQRGTHEIALTPTEFRLLALLAARRGTLVRRRALILAGWPDGAMVSENTLDSYVGRIRRKLRALGSARQITTVRGVGYRLA